VLICAGPTDRSSNAELADLLAASCTVINYDRRGRGRSGDTAPYSVDREIEDLQAVVDSAAGPVGLFGTSGAAFLAFRAAASGVPCVSIAVWEPPYILPGSRPPVPDDYADRQAELAEKGDTGAMAELFLVTAVGMPAQMVTGMRQAPFWKFMEAAASPALVYDAQLAGDFRLDPAQQAKVTCPVLVLDGGTTPGCPRPRRQWPPRLRPQNARLWPGSPTTWQPRLWPRVSRVLYPSLINISATLVRPS
jgi:alpha-beta hydrolase superfamily lysophospholipase